MIPAFAKTCSTGARRSREHQGNARPTIGCRQSVDQGKITVNHLRGFKRLYHVDRSEIIWLPEHIHAFMKVAPIEMQRTLILALHTGQQEGDLLRLPWSAYKGSYIELRQGKARRHGKPAPLIQIPCTAALRRCKPAPLQHQVEKENPMTINDVAGAPGTIRTSDPQIRSLVLPLN